MLTASDKASMNASLMEIRDGRSESIVIRRGSSTLPAQTVRIARRAQGGQRRDSDGAEEVRGDALVLGDTDLDIQPKDRFNDSNGVLYEVMTVRPNRDQRVEAEVEFVR